MIAIFVFMQSGAHRNCNTYIYAKEVRTLIAIFAFIQSGVHCDCNTCLYAKQFAMR